jgi:hypothetical protein
MKMKASAPVEMAQLKGKAAKELDQGTEIPRVMTEKESGRRPMRSHGGGPRKQSNSYGGGELAHHAGDEPARKVGGATT